MQPERHGNYAACRILALGLTMADILSPTSEILSSVWIIIARPPLFRQSVVVGLARTHYFYDFL